jgi:site-specific DNA recombinase
MRGVKKRKGWGEWSKATVHYILNNETYTGTWRYGKRNGNVPNPDDYLLTVKVPAIIDPDTWAAVRTRRAANKANSTRNTKYDYLIKGMGVCGHCGYKMQAHSYAYESKVNKTRYYYYRCPVRSYAAHYSPATCDLPNFRVEEVDEAVWDKVRELLISPDRLAQGLDHYLATREAANAPLKARLEGVASLIADNKRQLEKAIDLYLTGDFAREMLLERKQRLEDTIAALERQERELISQLETTLTPERITTIQTFAADIAHRLDAAGDDFPRRRRLLEDIEAEVTFAIEGGEKVIYLRCALSPDTTTINMSNNTKFGGLVATDPPECAGLARCANYPRDE